MADPQVALLVASKRRPKPAPHDVEIAEAIKRLIEKARDVTAM